VLPKDKANDWVVVKVPEKEEQLQEATKEPSPDQDIPKRSDLKVVRCHCKDVFPNLDSKMSID
jgi:hypothetical protein